MKKWACAFLVSVLLVFGLSGVAIAGWTGGHDVMGTPAAKTAWYFAEGCSRDGFNTWLCLYNPDQSRAADVNINYYLENGSIVPDALSVPAHSRTTVNVAEKCGTGHDIASQVTSTLPIVAERPMYFDHNGMTGGHVAMGASGPKQTWYFAEGCTQPGFEEWLCILNSEASQVNVDVDYLIEGATPVTERISVPAHTRFTRNVREKVGDGKNVSIRVTGATASDTVICERPMYFVYQGKWNGGHDAMGVNELSREWYFAEGCTRDGFDTWLTLQNAGDETAKVTTTYMLGTGQNVEKSYTVGPQTRKTVDVAGEVGRNQDVSMAIESSVPVAAERPMYFMYHGAWDGGSDSFGATAPGTNMLFAEGCSRTGFETWVCIQNPNSKDIQVNLSFAISDGSVKQVVLIIPARTRSTVSANELLGPEQDFSLMARSNDPFIAERPMYFDYAPLVPPESHLTAKFLNVGEADSCVVRVTTGSNNFFALIDTGKSGTSGTVVSALREMGCGKIDVLVLSHPDADHVGGAVDVMNSFPVGQVWDPGVDGDNTQTWQNVKATAAAKGIPRVNPRAGETYSWGGTQASILNPPAGAGYSGTNDYSLVLVQTLGNEDLMFTGDAESPAQQYMMSSTFPAIEVFKVPHHGGDSGCYQPFFNKVAPKNSVISVGSNSYGHPSASVISLLAGFGAVYRTDVNGNVTVDATANSLNITTDTVAPAPSPAPTPTPGAGPFWGSKNSDVYHYPSCSYAQNIKPENLVVFQTAAEAVAAGYRPCKVCGPPLP